MSDDDFTALARRAELEARKSPRLHRVKVAGLATVGYLFLWSLLLLTLGLVVLIVAGAVEMQRMPAVVLKPAFFLLAFCGVLLRAFWVRFEPPTGIRLRAADFPELHRTLDRIRRAVRGPRLHAVLLNDEFNAAITQVPRLGVFGWYRSYLVLGVPLLLALSRREMEFVLAHEYGHLSAAHGKLGTRIHRVRQTWSRLMADMERRRSWGAGMIRRFVSWYAPVFNGYSFALARVNEFEADAAAARLTNPADAAAALVRLETLSSWLHEDFWPSIHAGIGESPVPTARPFQMLLHDGFAAEPDRLATYLERGLAAEAGLTDTHPSLAERLEAFGVAAEPPQPVEESAADALLGPGFETLVERTDSEWRARVASLYDERFVYVSRAREKIREIDEIGTGATVEQLVTRAQMIDIAEGREAAVRAYEAVLERDAAHPEAGCVVGMYRILNGDPSGADLVEAAVQAEPRLILQAAGTLDDHYRATGHDRLPARFVDLFEKEAAIYRKAAAERVSAPFRRVYGPPDLPPDAVKRILDVLRANGRVRRAWLVRRPLKLSVQPIHVLAVELKTRFAVHGDSDDVAHAIVDRLGLLEEVVVVALVGESRSLKGIVKDVTGSRIL